MSSTSGHSVLEAWKEGAGCPQGFPPQAGPRPPADACFTRPAAPSETGFLRAWDRQTRSRVGRWRQPHTTQGKQSPAAQPDRLSGMGRGDSDSGSSGRAPRTPAPRRPPPAQGLGSAGGVRAGRGPMIWLELEAGSERAPAPTSVHSPRGRLPGPLRIHGLNRGSRAAPGRAAVTGAGGPRQTLGLPGQGGGACWGQGVPPWSEGWSLQKTRDTPLLRREGPGRPATSLATTLRSCHNARVSRLCPRQARETPSAPPAWRW